MLARLIAIAVLLSALPMGMAASSSPDKIILDDVIESGHSTAIAHFRSNGDEGFGGGYCLSPSVGSGPSGVLVGIWEVSPTGLKPIASMLQYQARAGSEPTVAVTVAPGVQIESAPASSAEGTWGCGGFGIYSTAWKGRTLELVGAILTENAGPRYSGLNGARFHVDGNDVEVISVQSASATFFTSSDLHYGAVEFTASDHSAALGGTTSVGIEHGLLGAFAPHVFPSQQPGVRAIVGTSAVHVNCEPLLVPGCIGGTTFASGPGDYQVINGASAGLYSTETLLAVWTDAPLPGS